MYEYIKRQEVVDLMHYYVDESCGSIVADIEKLPSTEIVYCRDCEFYTHEVGWCKKHSYFWDEEYNPCSPADNSDWKTFDENDFCSWGKLSKK